MPKPHATPSEMREQRLYSLVVQYHQQCDAFDATVCTGRSQITGEPMPRTVEEMRRAGAHAIQVRNRLAHDHGVTIEALRDALHRYPRPAGGFR